MSRRPYRSPRRAASALATRRAVLEAAESLFAAHGYAATTLARVAEAAGVSLATVKLVAPTKARLLLEAFRARVRGDAEEMTLESRESWRSLLAERDPDQLISRWVAIAAGAHERSAALLDAIVEAGGTDPELAEIERTGAAERRASYQAVIEALAGLGALREGLAPAAAVDIAWAINSPRTFRLFAQCGWSTERWAAWTAGALRREFLG